MEKELQHLIDELGEAINSSLAESDRFAGVMAEMEQAGRAAHSINWPPFTSIVSPMTKLAASDAKNAITLAHSMGVPTRPSGIAVTKLRIISGVENRS